jgi:hypothetical protein
VSRKKEPRVGAEVRDAVCALPAPTAAATEQPLAPG